MEVAPDFFSYMDAAAPLLLSDPSLLCVSAWNDNGKKDLIDTTRYGECEEEREGREGVVQGRRVKFISSFQICFTGLISFLVLVGC